MVGKSNQEVLKAAIEEAESNEYMQNSLAPYTV